MNQRRHSNQNNCRRRRNTKSAENEFDQNSTIDPNETRE
jgi:hypothetical protein